MGSEGEGRFRSGKVKGSVQRRPYGHGTGNDRWGLGRAAPLRATPGRKGRKCNPTLCFPLTCAHSCGNHWLAAACSRQPERRQLP